MSVGADQKVRFRHCEPLGEAIQYIDFQWIVSGFTLAMTCKILFLVSPYRRSGAADAIAKKGGQLIISIRL
ncbi:MAG: hypothetical protein LBN11_06790 [Tannerella sp.]|nr:hypothetical protein [Tannerella sp.]